MFGDFGWGISVDFEHFYKTVFGSELGELLVGLSTLRIPAGTEID